MLDQQKDTFLQSLLFFSVFFLSFAIRLAFISKGPYHVDCLNLAINAEQTLLTQKIHYLFGPGYPLAILLGAFFIYIFKTLGINDPVMAVNFMSVLFSSLCIYANYLLAKKLFNFPTALLSSISLSFFPIFLVISVYGKSHTPSIFFLLMGLVYLMNYHRNNRTRELILSSFYFGFMGATRLQDLILMGIPISFLFFMNPLKSRQKEFSFIKNKAALWSYIIFIFLILSILLLFHYPLIQNSYLKQLFRFWNIGVAKNFSGANSFSSLWISLRNIIFGLSPLGLLISLLGLLLLLKENWKVSLFLILWFFCPFLFYGNISSAAPRFLVLCSLPLILASGYGFAHLFRKNILFKMFALIIFLSMNIILFTNTYPILKFRHENALLPDFARYVKEKTEKNAQIITGDEGLFIRYYGERTIFPRPRGALATPEDIQAFKTTINEYLEQDIPLYITGTGLYSYDTHFKFSDMIKKEYFLKHIGDRTTEDWHRGGTRLRTGQEDLFRILKKLAPAS